MPPFRTPTSLYIARILGAIATGILLAIGTWGTIAYCRFRDDWPVPWRYFAGMAALGWALPVAACTIGVWRRQHWGCIGLAVLCGLQGAVQIGLWIANVIRLRMHFSALAINPNACWQYAFSPWQAAFLAYAVFLIAVTATAAMAAIQLPPPLSTRRGFPVVQEH